MPGPGFIKMFILMRGPSIWFSWDFWGFGLFLWYFGGFYGMFGEFYGIFGNFVDFYGEMNLWDRSHKLQFSGTGPMILGPVQLNWDQSPGNVFRWIKMEKVEKRWKRVQKVKKKLEKIEKVVMVEIVENMLIIYFPGLE